MSIRKPLLTVALYVSVVGSAIFPLYPWKIQMFNQIDKISNVYQTKNDSQISASKIIRLKPHFNDHIPAKTVNHKIVALHSSFTSSLMLSGIK